MPEPRRLPQASPLVHLLGKKWTIPVIEVLYSSRGSIQFNSIIEAVGGITPKNLSACLKELITAGFVERSEVTSIYYNGLIGTQYSLTKKGAAIHKFIMETRVVGASLYS